MRCASSARSTPYAVVKMCKRRERRIGRQRRVGHGEQIAQQPEQQFAALVVFVGALVLVEHVGEQHDKDCNDVRVEHARLVRLQVLHLLANRQRVWIGRHREHVEQLAYYVCERHPTSRYNQQRDDAGAHTQTEARTGSHDDFVVVAIRRQQWDQMIFKDAPFAKLHVHVASLFVLSSQCALQVVDGS